MWLFPPQSMLSPSGSINTYGVIGFGFNHNDDSADGYLQGGMNDQGLCMDANGLPVVSMRAYPSRERLFFDAFLEILLECKNVSEVITWFNSHYLGSTWSCQVHFADANGDAIVVSVADRKFTFTNKSNSHYLVSTNFNLANYNNGYYPCSRYNTATAMLGQIINEEDLTVDACRDLLDAVHQDGTYATKYSNIFDSVNLKVYLYYDRNFNQKLTLNLNAELAAVRPGGTGILEANQLYYKEISLASLLMENTIVTIYLLTLLISIVPLLSLVFVLSKRKGKP
jgi:hypothetical protein